MKQKRFTPMEMKYIEQTFIDTSGQINIIRDYNNSHIVKIEAHDIPKGGYRLDFGTIKMGTTAYEMLYELGLKPTHLRSMVSFSLKQDCPLLVFTLNSRDAIPFKKDLRIQEMFNKSVRKENELSR